MAVAHRAKAAGAVWTGFGKLCSWREVKCWMPLPPLPERDESKALLEDVFGGEWKKVLPNGYDCGDVHATVREHMVQVEYMTDDTTLCVTVHYEEGQSVRKALEILRDELREMHESVGGLLGEEKSPRERLREWLDDLCERVQERRWQECIKPRYHQAVDSALTGAHITRLDARDLERLTGISADKWMMMA